MKSNLAVFDLDGTLFDTNKMNFYSYKDALEACGYELDYSFFIKYCCGRSYKDFLPIIVRSDEEVKQVHALKKEKYPQYLNHARINTHLFHMIDKIKEDYHIAMVTTASRNNCQDILEYFKRKDCFELILTQEDVEFTKPSPEGFVKCMKYFGMSKEDTIIFEDSEAGIEAAVKSGAMVIKVQHWYTY